MRRAVASELAPQLALEALAVQKPGEPVMLSQLKQASLVATPLADVARHRRQADDLPALIAHRGDRQQHRDNAAVAAQAQSLEPVDRFACEHPSHQLRLLLAQRGWHDQRDRLTDRLRAVVAVEGFGAPIPAHDQTLGRLGDDRVLGGLDDVAEKLPVTLSLQLVGQIAGDADQPLRLAGRVADDRPAQLEPPLDAIAAYHRKALPKACGALPRNRGKPAPRPLAMVRADQLDRLRERWGRLTVRQPQDPVEAT